MRFTASAKYTAIARAAAKILSWKVYVRTVTDLSLPLTGSWVEVTDRLSFLADFVSAIEYQIGQYRADSVDFEAVDITWWKTNVFTAATMSDAGKYVELKVEVVLSFGGTDSATDTVTVFSGWIDKANVVTSEDADSITLTAYTAEWIGDQFIGESINTQYIENDLLRDGSNVQGLLTRLPGVYVRSANIDSKPLKLGIHRITYDYDVGPPVIQRAKLDNGDWVTLIAGNNTLGDVDNTASDTQRVQIYIHALGELSTSSNELTDDVIVVSQGTTLPKQWFQNAGLRFLLTTLYNTIGITTINYDALEINTALGGNKLSYIDNPPNDGSVTGKKMAVVGDASGDLWLGIGDKVFKRTASTSLYQLKVNLANSAMRIARLLYNKRTGHHEDLWIFYGDNVDGRGRLRRYKIDTDSLSSEINLQGAFIDATWYKSIEVVDYNYTGSSYLYAVVYGNTRSTDARQVDGSTLTDSAIVTISGLNSENFNCMFPKASNELWIRSSATAWDKLVINASGVWVHTANVLTGVESYRNVAYNATDDRIVYEFVSGAFRYIKSTDTISGTTSTQLTLASAVTAMSGLYARSDRVHFTVDQTVRPTGQTINHQTLYSAVSNTAATVLTTGVHSIFSALTYSNARLYGIDVFNRLWQYHTTLALYVPIADFEGQRVHSALTNLLQGFNLIGGISSTKQAFVFRRGNSSGTPQHTGNTLKVDVGISSLLVEQINQYLKVGLVEVSNGVTKYNYDGTNYNTEVFNNVRQVKVANDLLPDNIIQDLTKYFYEFFKSDRSMYRVTLGIVPLFQFEPFDACELDFTTTKIQKTGTGVIYGTVFSRDGSMQVEVLL